MLEEMQTIDTSVIDELMEVKKERETVAARLAKMTAEQTQVSDVVFHRVKRDYETRLSGLEQKAAPLKEKGRQEFAKLKTVIDRLDSQNQSTQFDKEELEFRHRLGEFEGKEFDTKLAELEAKLAEQNGQLAETGELRGRFVAAFDSEEELATPPAVPAPADAAGLAAPPAPPAGALPLPGAPAPPPAPEPELSGTVMLSTQPQPDARPAEPVRLNSGWQR